MANALTSSSKERKGAGLLARAFACILSMAILGGCATHKEIEYDAQNPAVRVSRSGIFLGDRSATPEEVASHLTEYGVPHDTTIHIRLDQDVRDLRPARYLMAVLRKAGYTRPVLVTERHAESVNLGRARPRPRR